MTRSNIRRVYFWDDLDFHGAFPSPVSASEPPTSPPLPPPFLLLHDNNSHSILTGRSLLPLLLLLLLTFIFSLSLSHGNLSFYVAISMATTRKDVVPTKERAGRSALSHATAQNPRPRPTRPSSSSSEKDASLTSPRRTTTTPNYLKPTLSSSPESSKIARPPQKSLSVKKVTADARTPPLRSSSFNAPRQAKTTLLPSKATFLSERTTKGKATSSAALKSEIPGAEGKTKDKDSRPSSANPSAAGSTKAAPPANEETLSGEDKQSALDILNLDVEEHVLVEISSPEGPTHLEDAAGVITALKGPEVGDGDEDEGKKAGDREEMTREEDEEEEEAPGEVVEKLRAEKSGGEDEDRATEQQETGGGEDGGKERLKRSVEDEARGKEKGKEAAPPQGKKEAPPAYNDVIEETASKLAEKRKSKVLALVGAFETVISLDSGGQAQ